MPECTHVRFCVQGIYVLRWWRQAVMSLMLLLMLYLWRAELP